LTSEEWDDSRFAVPVVEEVVWFDVSVNDPKLVDVSQGRQQPIDVQTDFFKAQCANNVLMNAF